MKKQHILSFALLLSLTPIQAESFNSTDASEATSLLLSLATLSVAAIPLVILSGAGSLVIESITYVGDNSKIMLKSDSGKGSILVSGHVTYAVGQSVEKVITSAGVVLSIAGEVIAFIPNELGKSLIYQAKR